MGKNIKSVIVLGLCAHDVTSKRFHLETFRKALNFFAHFNENHRNLVSEQKLKILCDEDVYIDDIIFSLAIVKTLGNDTVVHIQ